jgi:hypothetical protein
MSTDHPVFSYEEQLVNAQLSGDVAALDILLDDSLLYTGLSGEIGHKQDDLNLHRSGRFRITKMRMIERHMIELGSTAVINVLMDTAASIDGAAIAKILRYTRVWSLRQTQWQLVAAHLSEFTGKS